MRTRPRVEIGSSHADSDSNNCPGSSDQYELQSPVGDNVLWDPKVPEHMVKQ